MPKVDLDAVEALMREAAEELILPRFRALDTTEIDQKNGPEDLVTVADREAEERLTPQLEDLLPGSRVVGEEGVSAGDISPEILAQDGPFWLVDPVDGTWNFVHGKDRFGVMVALVERQEVRAGWILFPVDGRCAKAELGSGATFGDEPILRKSGASWARARGDYSHSYVDEPYRSAFLTAVEGAGPVRQGRCSAYAYTDLARGELDYVLQYKMTPWDHAAGQLIVEESGGRFGFLPGGERYAPIWQDDRPMLAVAAADDWDGYADKLAL